ncbi:MAG: hypothetical protein ACI4F1_09185 [Bariatricus sp.]
MKSILVGNETGKKQFYLKKLQEEYLDTAVALCDRCVGVNLYPKKELASAIRRNDHFFYLLFAPDGKAAGYIYYYTTTVKELSARARLPEEQIAKVCANREGVIGNIQSIGVEDAYRGNGLSVSLLEFSLKNLAALMADTAFIVCWKIGERVPLRASLEKLDFCYLSDAHKVWYDVPNLICPYCEGRCKCDAAVYYKPLTKEEAL